MVNIIDDFILYFSGSRNVVVKYVVYDKYIYIDKGSLSLVTHNDCKIVGVDCIEEY